MAYGLILAAGFGSRLGHDMPKGLIPWGKGTILDLQLARLEAAGVKQTWIVVGFQAERVRAHLDGRTDLTFVENEAFMDTQTGRSMLLGLRAIPPGGVVTLNSDVVFDDGIIKALLARPAVTKMAAVPKVCGDEEMKYRVREGRLQAISKQVHGEGEVVGINYVAQDDRPTFERALSYLDAGQYFERAFDQMLPFTARPVEALDITPRRAMEIDFPEDLDEARRIFGK